MLGLLTVVPLPSFSIDINDPSRHSARVMEEGYFAL